MFSGYFKIPGQVDAWYLNIVIANLLNRTFLSIGTFRGDKIKHPLTSWFLGMPEFWFTEYYLNFQTKLDTFISEKPFFVLSSPLVCDQF